MGTGEVEARSVVALPSTPPERSLGRRSCRLIRASSILNCGTRPALNKVEMFAATREVTIGLSVACAVSVVR